MCTVVLNMQRASFLGRIGNSSLLGEKAVLRRNVFTMEGLGRGNGVPCSSVGNREQVEVMKLKDFNMDGGCQYNKQSRPSEKGWSSRSGFYHVTNY